MRILCPILMVVLSAALACAGTKDLSLDELKARLEGAKPDDQEQICVSIAERQVAAADTLFKQNKNEEAQAAVREVVVYAGRARDAAAVTGHRLKNAEIDVRKMAHKLSDVKRPLALEEQAPVQAAIDQLEKIRTDLLDKMFKGGK